MKIVFLLGLFLAVNVFSFGQDAKTEKEQKAQQKKEQHVKVMVSQNGKTIKIDTTFNLPDEKAIQFKVDSILKKYGKGGMAAGDGKVIILRGGKGLTTIDGGRALPGQEQYMVTYSTNDTGKVKHERKVIRIPPPPPVPPIHGAQAVRVQGFRLSGGDPFAFDPDNKDIISYDKKDIGKGLEKITIVRKKQVDKEQKKNVEVKVEVQDEQKK